MVAGPCLSSNRGGFTCGLLGFCVIESNRGERGESNLGEFHCDSVVCQAFAVIITGHSKWPGCSLKADHRLKN